MFERYTENPRRVVFFARFEASQRGGLEIEPYDLFLGATHGNHRSGCPFNRLFVDRDKLREILAIDKKPATSMQVNIQLSSSGKRSLTCAAEEADQDGSRVIGVEHLLRGALRVGDETLNRLADEGYTLTALRSASQEAQRLEQEKKAFWGECGCGRKEPPTPPDMSQVRILKRKP